MELRENASLSCGFFDIITKIYIKGISNFSMPTLSPFRPNGGSKIQIGNEELRARYRTLALPL